MRLFTHIFGILILQISWINCVHAEDIDDKLVYIECSENGVVSSQGTGVLVSSKGHVLTAKHVVPDGSSCEGIIANSTYTGKRRGLVKDPRSVNVDAVLLNFMPSHGESFPYIKYCKIEDSLRLKNITVWGWSKYTKGQASARSGDISTTTPDQDGSIETTAETTPGISGGPAVLRDNSCLIGIAKGAATDSKGLAAHYAVIAAEGIADTFNLEEASVAPIITCSVLKNRTKVILYPYRGLGGLDSTASYSDLEEFLLEKMKTIGNYFYNEPDAKYLGNLCVEKSPNKPKTLTEFIEEWRKQNALLLMDGVITKNTSNSNENIAKSSIYFGDLTQILPNNAIRAIHTDLLLDSSQYGTISDTHSAATLFSLAVHAKNDGLSTAYYLRLAGLARETLNTIKMEGGENKDIKELRCTLERFISDTTKQPILIECQ